MTELPYERRFRRWAEARGMGWEQLRYPRPAAGGETVAYRITPAGAARATVLAVHGAGNDALFALVGMFKRLLRRGFAVFSFDLDGHGRSSTTRFAAEAARGSVVDALAHARAPAPGLPVHALGISLGGAVLLHALPGLAVASAILVTAPLRIQFGFRSFLTELRPPMLATLWRERRHFGLTGLIPSFGPFKRGVYPLRLAEPQPGSFGYVVALNRALEHWNLPQAAERTEVPVLLVYGTSDRLVPAAQGERLHRLIPGSELMYVPGATHLFTPIAPSAIAHMLRWLERRSPAPSP